jgi:hypothetical protein
MLGNQLKEPVLALAPDVYAPTHGRSLGALVKTAEGLEVLELRLEGQSGRVCARLFVCLIVALTRGSGFRSRCKPLYKRVGTLLPNVRALCTRIVCGLCELLWCGGGGGRYRSAGSLDAPFLRGWHGAAWCSLRALVGNSDMTFA